MRNLAGWAAVVWITLATCGLAGAEPHVVGSYTVEEQGSDGRDYPAGDSNPTTRHYHLDIGGLEAVEPGTILVAYRRVPARRGDAEFRSHPVWMESGRLQVVGLGTQWATARLVSGPPTPLPALDDDGLPQDLVCIGDRLVETGEEGLRTETITGQFESILLFHEGGSRLSDDGRQLLALWISRFDIRGPVRISVVVDGEALSEAVSTTINEHLHPMADGIGVMANVERIENAEAAARRRAAAVAEAVEQMLGRDPGTVLATVSWPGSEQREPGMISLMLMDASARLELRPEENPADGPIAERTGEGS